MIKKIKSEALAGNFNQMRINFAGRVKNFHNLKLRGILRIGLFKWKEIGGGE